MFEQLRHGVKFRLRLPGSLSGTFGSRDEKLSGVVVLDDLGKVIGAVRTHVDEDVVAQLLLAQFQQEVSSLVRSVLLCQSLS